MKNRMDLEATIIRNNMSYEESISFLNKLWANGEAEKESLIEIYCTISGKTKKDIYEFMNKKNPIKNLEGKRFGVVELSKTSDHLDYFCRRIENIYKSIPDILERERKKGIKE